MSAFCHRVRKSTIPVPVCGKKLCCPHSSQMYALSSMRRSAGGTAAREVRRSRPALQHLTTSHGVELSTPRQRRGLKGAWQSQHSFSWVLLALASLRRGSGGSVTGVWPHQAACGKSLLCRASRRGEPVHAYLFGIFSIQFMQHG